VEIEVRQNKPIQEGRPGAVRIIMHADDGRCIGTVDVWPVMVPAKDFNREEIRVVVMSGDGPLSPTIDLRTVLK